MDYKIKNGRENVVNSWFILFTFFFTTVNARHKAREDIKVYRRGQRRNFIHEMMEKEKYIVCLYKTTVKNQKQK